MPDIKIRKEDQDQSTEDPNMLRPLALWRRLFRVSLGTMVIAQEEAEKLINALVEQGELAEKEGKRFMTKLVTTQRKQIRKTEERGDAVVEEVLLKLQIPSQAKVASLEKRIAELSAKLDQLQAETTEAEIMSEEPEAA